MRARSFISSTCLLAALTCVLAAWPSVAAAEGTLHGEYFVLPSTHPDVGHAVDGAIVTGLVEKQLSPNHLPIVTKFARSYKGPSGPISDVNAAGELLWYARGGKTGIRNVKSSTDRLPFKFDAMFPPGKTADGGTNGYLSVHWSGTFDLPKSKTIGFRLGSDDDSWVFIDGRLVVDNGGVKPEAVAPFTVSKLAAGQHRFDIFYADRHGSGAALDLSTDFNLTPPAKPSAPGATIPKAAALAAQIKKTGHVAIYGIHFAFDRATITKDSDAVLAEVGQLLRDDRTLRVRIDGHTDNAGDPAYNLELSQQRADAVKAYLVSRWGIAASRLLTQGFGSSRPVATNATSKGRYQNRRVELTRI